jgi:hypothetical protein
MKIPLHGPDLEVENFFPRWGLLFPALHSHSGLGRARQIGWVASELGQVVVDPKNRWRSKCITRRVRIGPNC